MSQPQAVQSKSSCHERTGNKKSLFLSSFVIAALGSVAIAQSEPRTKPAPAKAVFFDIDAVKTKKLLDEAAAKKKEEIVVLDIRTPSEFKSGHLVDAVNIDYRAADFEAKLKKLDRGKTYAIY